MSEIHERYYPGPSIDRLGKGIFMARPSQQLRFFGCLTVLLGLATPLDAHAYIDPGTGSIILQAFVAGIVGALFTIKMYWRRITAFVSGFFRRTPQA